MKLTREMLPKRVSFNGTSIPVKYNGEIRRISDVHYGNNSLIYLKDNIGEPVLISELEIETDWLLIIADYKKLEENRCAKELGIKEIHWKKHNQLLISIARQERKLFNEDYYV